MGTDIQFSATNRLPEWSALEHITRICGVASAFGAVAYPALTALAALTLLVTEWWRWGAFVLVGFVVLAAVPIFPRPGIVDAYLRQATETAAVWVSLKVVYDANKFSAPGPYVIGLEPHSVLPTAIPTMMNTVSDKLPRTCQPCHSLATSAAFFLPVAKHWWWWLDIRPATRAWMHRLLAAERTVCVVPGGVQECLYMDQDKEVAFLKNRRGFVRIALQHGAPLVPAFAFGQTNLFHYLRPGPPLISKDLLARISRALGFVPLLLWGWWFTTMPLRAPMTVVLGDPIPLPRIEEPSGDQCQLYLDQFVATMERLVREHKGAAGHERLRFEVI